MGLCSINIQGSGSTLRFLETKEAGKSPSPSCVSPRHQFSSESSRTVMISPGGGRKGGEEEGEEEGGREGRRRGRRGEGGGGSKGGEEKGHI